MSNGSVVKRLELATLLTALREQLEEADAQHRQKLVERAAAADGGDHVPFVLKDIVLEAQVATEVTEGAEGSVKFWVLTGALKDSQRSTATQKIFLRFEPMADLYAGDES